MRQKLMRSLPAENLVGQFFICKSSQPLVKGESLLLDERLQKLVQPSLIHDTP
jgi:hypothetical protein